MPIQNRDSVNMNQNELQNARLQQLSADPSTAVEGQIWHRNDTHRAMVRNNTENKQLAWLTDILDPFGIMKDPTGWEDPHLISETYDPVERTITLTTTNPTLRYMFNGVITDLGSNTWTSTAHADSPEEYYLFSYDGVDFIWFLAPWLFSYIQVASVLYSSSTKAIAVREIHGVGPHSYHQTCHWGIGTQRDVATTPTGGTLTGFALGSSATADRRPGATAINLLDEDLPTVVAAMPDGGPYSHLYLASSTTIDYDLETQDEIIHMSGTTPQIQNPTTAAWSNVRNTKFACVYLVAIPSCLGTVAQKSRWIWMQGQAEYASLDLAKNEIFANLNRGNLTTAFAEFLPVAKVIIQAKATYFSIEYVEQLYGSRSSSVGVPSPAATIASSVNFTPSGNISAADVQAAIQELDTEKERLVYRASITAATDFLTLSAGYYKVTGGTMHANNPAAYSYGRLDITAFDSTNKLVTYYPHRGGTLNTGGARHNLQYNGAWCGWTKAIDQTMANSFSAINEFVAGQKFLQNIQIWDNFANANLSIGMSSQVDGIDPGLAAGPRTGEGADAFIIRDSEGQWTAFDHFRAFDTLGCGGVASLNSVVSERTITGGQQVSPTTAGTYYVDPREFTVLNIGTLTGNFGIELVGAACPPGTVQHISFRQGATARSVTFTSVFSTTFRQNGVDASGTSRAVSGVGTVSAYYTMTLKWIDTNIVMITVG